jgi:hypothetical protein
MNTKGLYTQQIGLSIYKTGKSSLEGDKSMELTGLPKCRSRAANRPPLQVNWSYRAINQYSVPIYRWPTPDSTRIWEGATDLPCFTQRGGVGVGIESRGGGGGEGAGVGGQGKLIFLPVHV